VASLGSTPGLVIAAGVGAAAATALEPAFEVPRQDAWARLPNKILDVRTLARLAAQGGVTLGNADGSTPGSAYGEAIRQGYAADKLQRLVWLELTAPDLAVTLELWRRGLLGPVDDPKTIKLVEYALAKEQIEPAYWPALKELFSGRLNPALIATMVQRSILPNSVDPNTKTALLPVSQTDAANAVYDNWNASTTTQLKTPAPTGHNVTPMPQVGLDPILEARAWGIDFDRLAAETRIVGLPASPDLAARMVYRGIGTPQDFVQAVAEGNARIEWAPALFEAFREILTASQYAELQLRGFLDRPGRLAHTLKHGMSEADSDLLYNLLGRSIPEHQIVTGEARGGTFEGPIDTIPKAFLQSLQRGNLRPEYYNLAYANRYSYPSAFVLRSLATSGEITEAEAEQLLLQIGWPPDLAKKVSASWAPAGTAAKVNPWVKAQQTRLVTAMHKAFVKTGVSRAQLEPYLDTIVTDAADKDEIFRLWGNERAVDALTAA